jgi:UDP-N-acetylglucosamine 4,6-dehydratase
MSSVFDDKVLLITGGTGSFGHAVVDRFLKTKINLAAHESVADVY